MSEAASAGRAGPRPLSALAGIGLAAAIVFAALVALGAWQLQRRAWKHALIARVDARIHATPVTAPGPLVWRTIGDKDAYLRVAATGAFLPGRDTLVQAVTELGPGWWVLTPLRDNRGFTVLINRGFVAAAPAPNPPEGTARVIGLLRVGEPGGGFLRHNDPATGRWYSRDVAAIAQARRLGAVAPYFIDAEATAASGAPVGGLTVVAFTDNHLQYALTWFALAALLAGGGAWVARDEWRVRRDGRR